MRLIGRVFLLFVVIALAQPAPGAEPPRMVADIFPDRNIAIGLSPEGMTKVGNSVFIIGRRDDLGRELWVLLLGLFVDGFESGDATAWSLVIP